VVANKYTRQINAFGLGMAPNPDRGELIPMAAANL
jgi:hypothetical protein